MVLSLFRSFAGAARTFVRLPLPAKVDYAVVVALAGFAEVGLRVLPLRQLSRLLNVGYPAATPPAEPDRAAELQLPQWALTRLRTVSTVMRRWPVDGTCLRHSLIAGQRLRRLSPELVIGVRRTEQGAAEAHAWLQIGGVSLDPASEMFHTLPAAS